MDKRSALRNGTHMGGMMPGMMPGMVPGMAPYGGYPLQAQPMSGQPPEYPAKN